MTIITGFLGSGKPTLLNHILQDCQDLKVAVLVNEFGDIDIDSQLLVSADEDMAFESNSPFDLDKFQDWLADDLSENVFRAKDSYGLQQLHPAISSSSAANATP